MIKVYIHRDAQKRVRKCIIKGHAGRSIICAGVSSLSQACTRAALELVPDKGSLHLGKGYLALTILEPNKDTELLMSTLVSGLRAIQRWDVNRELEIREGVCNE